MLILTVDLTPGTITWEGGSVVLDREAQDDYKYLCSETQGNYRNDHFHVDIDTVISFPTEFLKHLNRLHRWVDLFQVKHRDPKPGDNYSLRVVKYITSSLSRNSWTRRDE